MAKQTFTTGQVLTAAQMTSLQQTAMGGGSTTAKTASYVLVAADAGTVVQMNSASATTITVNTALFAAGDTVQIQNVGAGVCTVTAGTATVSTAGSLALSQYEGGYLYFNTTSAALFFDTVQATASSGSEQVAGKNAVINGDFLINQRAFTSNTTTGAYNFDRWLQQNSGGTFTVTPQTFTPGAAPIATYEGRKYLQGVTATQSAAGDYAIISQRIEDVTRYAGTTVTISFFAKANTGTPKIGVELWQDYGSGGSPSTAATVAQGSVTLTTSWVRYSVSLAVPSLTGKTLGTTANTSYLELNFWQSAGSTYNTRSSTTGIQNFTLSLWGVQLEYASSATYFTTASGSIAGELALAQRYYFQDAVAVLNTQQAVAATIVYGVYYLPQAMRANPTLTQTGASVGSSNTAATSYTYDATPASPNKVGFYITGGASTGQVYLYRPIQLSAEL